MAREPEMLTLKIPEYGRQPEKRPDIRDYTEITGRKSVARSRSAVNARAHVEFFRQSSVGLQVALADWRPLTSINILALAIGQIGRGILGIAHRQLVSMRLKAALGIAIGLSVTAIGARHISAQSSPTLRGEAIAQQQCARCHAVGVSGDSPMGRAPPFRELSRRYPIENLAESLAEGIVTGHSGMPVFTFDPRDIDALLSYISGLQRSSGRGESQRQD
jgi:mono/diheme cytochrome c family protein